MAGLSPPLIPRGLEVGGDRFRQGNRYLYARRKAAAPFETAANSSNATKTAFGVLSPIQMKDLQFAYATA